MRTSLLIRSFACLGACVASGVGLPVRQSAGFTFRPLLESSPHSLTVQEPRVSGAVVTITGGDSRRPTTPFTFEWGDGSTSESFFPARHEYSATDRDYTVTVTAHYRPGQDSRSVRVRFRPPVYEFRRDPRIPARVCVASAPVELGSTMTGYKPPSNLKGFADGELSVPRAAIEYALDVGHFLQTDFCNGDIDLSGGDGQVVLSQPGFGGAFSLWFTKPISMGANPSYLSSLAGISSLYHEMGHNLTLNSPARYRFGGKTDGPFNTVVSETLAQIMQHATAWEILNHPARYGLGPEIADGLTKSAEVSFGITARAYRDYVAQGCPFTTRQIPGRQGDPTFGTFMSLAYVFVEQAEDRRAFRAPLKRMMALLQTFNERDHRRYRVAENDAFRATFMVAAMSHGFGEDLRPRFRQLKFALDDAVYAEMMARMRP